LIEFFEVYFCLLYCRQSVQLSIKYSVKDNFGGDLNIWQQRHRNG